MRSTTTWLLSIQCITFSSCFHHLLDIHHCYWFSVTFSVHFNVRKKKNWIWENMRGGKSSDSLTMEFTFCWVTSCDGLKCLCVWQPWILSQCWNKMSFMKQYLWCSVLSVKDGKNQKWNKVYFKMHFWLISKVKSERFMTTQQCKYKS